MGKANCRRTTEDCLVLNGLLLKEKMSNEKRNTSDMTYDVTSSNILIFTCMCSLFLFSVQKTDNYDA